MLISGKSKIVISAIVVFLALTWGAPWAASGRHVDAGHSFVPGRHLADASKAQSPQAPPPDTAPVRRIPPPIIPGNLNPPRPAQTPDSALDAHDNVGQSKSQAPTTVDEGLPPASARQPEMPLPTAAPTSDETIRRMHFPPSPSATANREVSVIKGNVSLNFDDADVYSVIQTVFGEILKVNYIIDSRVKGRVTFRSVAPVPREKVLPLMEVILRLNGVAVIEDGGYIYTSTDSGENWTTQATAGNRSWTSIASSSDGTRLAAVASGGSIWTGYSDPKPVIPSPPTTGPIGGTITINGSNFGDVQGSGYVDFNGVHGVIVSWIDTQIVVTIPRGATSGCLKIVTDFGESDCVNFIIASMLYANFAGAGIWKWDGSSWTQTTSSNPELLVTVGSDLYGTFPGMGIWNWNGSDWSNTTNSVPQRIVGSSSILYGTFTGMGIWEWNGTAWSQTTSSIPQTIIASTSELYATFAGMGIWKWNGSIWSNLTTSIPDLLVTSGVKLYGTFPGAGIWLWDGTQWTQATPNTPQMIAGNSTTLYGAFEGAGIWTWAGSDWTQISTDNPTQMVAAEDALYAVFTSIGIRKWDGTNWTTISGNIPENMVVGN